MPNDTGLSGWTLGKFEETGEQFPCYMHPRENKFIQCAWEDVPEEMLFKWVSENVIEAIYQMGVVSLEKKEYQKAWDYFSRGAKRNDKFCIFYLGVMVNGGIGVEANKKIALNYFQQAAELGHLDSQYNLAQDFLSGESGEQDIHKAIYYYEKAANQGDPESNYNLGVIYFVGDLVQGDRKKALVYFKAALNLGLSKAQQFIDKIEASKDIANKTTEQKATTKFICLANSFKEGGRCLAGIELDGNNNPVLTNGRPKWIRPVCNTPHGEVPADLVAHLGVLSIIEIDVTEAQQGNYQSENVLFRENSIRVLGNFSKNNLTNLCENPNVIFGNRGKAVPEDAIGNLTYSLMLVRVSEFEVIQKVYEDNPDRPKTRLVFIYNNHQYDFPITDPVFLHRYQINPDLLEEVNQVYLSLSLGVNWQNWYYKLIAAIIY